MRQIQFNDYGKPEVLKLIEVNRPEPKIGEVLIKVEAVGVNYADVLRRKNIYFMPTPLPFVSGTEAVGEIVELGEKIEASAFQVGNRVLAILPAGGGYSEYVSADAQFCIPLPPQIDADEATAIFVQGSTAYLILHQVAKEFAGKSILIHAASGGVGSILVQLAKLGGANKVFGASSSDEKLSFARAVGADETVNYSNADWTKKVIEANGGKKVDLILEMVGGEIYRQSFECLEKGGTAFQELFSAFQNQLKSYLYRLLTNCSDAEDLMHDTFIRAYDSLSTSKGNSTLKTWVFQIATNLAFNQLKSRKRWQPDVLEKGKLLA